MELRGVSVELHGVPWSSVKFHVITWSSMELHGVPWNYMEFHVITWSSMELYGIPWINTTHTSNITMELEK